MAGELGGWGGSKMAGEVVVMGKYSSVTGVATMEMHSEIGSSDTDNTIVLGPDNNEQSTAERLWREILY